VVVILTWSAIATVMCCVTNRTALSFWDYYLSTVRHFITLHLIAQDGPTVTNTDPAWFRFPDVSVCVHLPVLCTAQLILYKQKEGKNYIYTAYGYRYMCVFINIRCLLLLIINYMARLG